MKYYLYALLFFILSGVTCAVAEDCTAVGRKIAAEQGGHLSKATFMVQDGKNICVIVVLVPGRNGEKPRRVEVAVPAS